MSPTHSKNPRIFHSLAIISITVIRGNIFRIRISTIHRFLISVTSFNAAKIVSIYYCFVRTSSKLTNAYNSHTLRLVKTNSLIFPSDNLELHLLSTHVRKKCIVLMQRLENLALFL